MTKHKAQTPEALSNPSSLFSALVVLLAVGGAVWIFFSISKEPLDQRNAIPESYTYDLSTYQKVDPALLTYSERPAIATGFRRATCLALGSKGMIYVGGDLGLRVLKANGEEERTLSLAAKPTALAVSKNGVMYVASKDSVIVMQPEGASRTLVKGDGKTHFTSVALGDKDLYIADAIAKSIFTIPLTGGELRLFAGKGEEGDPKYVIPSPHFDVAVDRKGRVHAVDPGRHTIKVYRSDGSFSHSWGKFGAKIEGFSGCCNPTDIALLPDGGMLTTEKGIPRAKEYDHEGVLQGVIGAPEVFAAKVKGMDIVVTDAGLVLILDTSRNTIRVFEKISKASATTVKKKADSR